jgi:hypothetical protein
MGYWVRQFSLPSLPCLNTKLVELSRANSAGFMWSVVDFNAYVWLYILLIYSQFSRVGAPLALSQDVLFNLLARFFFHALKIWTQVPFSIELFMDGLTELDDLATIYDIQDSKTTCPVITGRTENLVMKWTSSRRMISNPNFDIRILLQILTRATACMIRPCCG